MKIAVNDLGFCRKELKVELGSETVSAAQEEAYRAIQRVARVPGFRIGRAPRDLVVRRYASRAREETIRRLIGRHLPEALEQAKLDVLGDPEITEVSFDENGDDKKPLTFTARCEIMPVIQVRGLKGIKVERPSTEVKEQQIEEALERLQEQRSELVPQDPRAVVQGEYAVVDFTCSVEGKQIEKRDGATLHVDPEEDKSGLSRHLVGVAPGAIPVTFETKLPDDLPAKNCAGKTASFSVILKEVKVKRSPALDDEFAKKLGAENLEALKTNIRKNLQEELDAQARRSVEDQVVQKLLEKTAFDVPGSLVKSQAERLMKDAQLQLLFQGINPDEIQGRQQLLEEKSKQDALKRVKSFFLLRQWAKDQNLTATEQEVEARIQQMARQSQRDVEEVRRELQERRLLGELVWDVVRRKALDTLLKEVAA
ncbi:MAG: trigger factor [Candidatus Omnitrophica bacterium]|nr:trigger factor [Candidatus Omnitrophota bacterium]